MAQRLSFGRQLSGEIPEWIQQGFITQAQGQAILARYPTERDGPRRSLQVVAIAGSALVGLGVILIIANNWNAIHPWVKLLGLFALLAGANYGGWRLRFGEPAMPRVGEGLLLLGGMLFLAGIGLVSQIYHLDARPANGVLLWWIGIAAMPWLVRSASLQALSTLAFVVWLGMEAATADSWIYLGNNLWKFAAGACMLGGALFLGGEREKAWPLMWAGKVVGAFGLALFAGGTYVLGFVRHRDILFWDQRAGRPWLLLLLVVALLALLPGSVGRLARGTEGWGLLASFVATLLIAAVVGLVLPMGGWDVTSAVLFWALQIAFALLLVSAGVREERPGWVNLGAFLFALQVITRYFDLFGTMLDTGLLFLVGGTLLLAVGYLTERKRRQLLAGMATGRV